MCYCYGHIHWSNAVDDVECVDDGDPSCAIPATAVNACDGGWSAMAKRDSYHDADAVSDVTAGNVSVDVIASQKPRRKRRQLTGKSERRDDGDASSAATNDEKRVKRHAQSRGRWTD